MPHPSAFHVQRRANLPKPHRAAAGLLAAFVSGALLCAAAAHASPIVVTTTGTVDSGTDAGNLLGAGTLLAGDRYTLSVTYADPLSAPDFYSDGSTVASVPGDALPGSVVLTVAGHSFFAAIVGSYGATLEEDAYDLAASNAGLDGASNYVYAFQSISTALPFVSVADLQTGLTHALTADDSGSDSFQFNNAAFTQSISFTGTTASVVMQAIPEPSSWALMAAGLAALTGRLRRRKSVHRA